MIYMPHPGHFICAQDCKFFLNTYVNGYIVSTVGEFLPDSQVREVFAESRGIKLRGMGDERKADYMRKIGFEDIGYNRKYETMVFVAKPSDLRCCPYKVADAGDCLEQFEYNDPGDAYEGHRQACLEFANKTPPEAGK